jgi:peptidyl-prolyl cis-trans isomerase C
MRTKLIFRRNLNMQLFCRTVTGVIIVLAAAFFITACAKQPPVAASGSPMPLLHATKEDKHIVVARVNGSDITMYSLIGMINRITTRRSNTSATMSPEKIIEKALDDLILEELSYQEAVRQGLRIEQPDIDKAIQNLKRNVGSEQQFRDYLTEGDLTEADLRARVERLLLINAVFTREVLEKVTVSDEDVRQEYERQKDQFILPEKLAAIDIVFFLALHDPASIQKANTVLATLNADADKDPGNLAPDKTFIVRNMDLALEKSREPELYQAARRLKQGELSPVITTRDSIHILKLTDFSPESWKPLKEVRNTVEIGLKTALQKKRRDEWTRELQKTAKIEIIGANESQRPGVRRNAE